VRGVVLELVKQLVEVLAIEDQTGALRDRYKVRAPLLIESTSLDANVVHRFQIGEAALHEVTPWKRRTHAANARDIEAGASPEARGSKRRQHRTLRTQLRTVIKGWALGAVKTSTSGWEEISSSMATSSDIENNAHASEPSRLPLDARTRCRNRHMSASAVERGGEGR